MGLHRVQTAGPLFGCYIYRRFILSEVDVDKYKVLFEYMKGEYLSGFTTLYHGFLKGQPETYRGIF